MGTLYIEEYADLLEDITGKSMQATDQLLTRQQINLTSASVQGNAFQANAKYIMVISDVACNLEISDSPFATSDTYYLPANTFRVLSTKNGSTIAAIELQTPAPPLDITAYTTTSNTFSVTTQETIPQGVTWNNDGTSVYVAGWIADGGTQYNATTPYDITTLSLDDVNNLGTTGAYDIVWKPDGTQFFVPNNTTTLEAFTAGTAFDLSTFAADNSKDYTQVEDSNLRGAVFSADGTKMILTGLTSDSLHEYTLSTPWDPSTATLVQSFDMTTELSNPTDLTATNNGKSLVVCNSSSTIFQYNLTAAFDLSTISFFGSVSVGGSTATGTAFNPDNSIMTVVDTTNDRLEEFT